MCLKRKTICSNSCLYLLQTQTEFCTYTRIYSKHSDGIQTAEEVHRIMGRVRHLLLVKYLYRRPTCSFLPHGGAINHRPPPETGLRHCTSVVQADMGLFFIMNVQWLKWHYYRWEMSHIFCFENMFSLINHILFQGHHY